MGIENCTHPYYRMVDNRLLCVMCDAPSARFKVENKESKPKEKKRGVIWPQRSKRIK